MKDYILFMLSGPLVSYLCSPPGHPHVKRIVAAHLCVSKGSAVLIGVHQGAVLFWQDQGHHHGGTTHQSSLGETS